jgi:hypothetical protein
MISLAAGCLGVFAETLGTLDQVMVNSVEGKLKSVRNAELVKDVM